MNAIASQSTAAKSRVRERIYIIPTLPGIAFGLSVFLVFAAGYFSQGFGGPPQVLVIALVVGGIIILFQTNDNLRGITLVSARSAPVVAGGESILEVAVANRSAQDRFALRVRFRDGWALRGAAYIPALPAGEVRVVSLRLPAPRRGVFPIPAVWVSGNFPAGLCFAWRVFSGLGETLVYPQARSWREFPVLGHTAGTDDVAGHRDYIPGDPIGRVDWKLYAKSGRLNVRTLAAPGRQSIRWEDTGFLVQGEERLQQMAAWLDECLSARKPFDFRLPGTALDEGQSAACRAALARFVVPVVSAAPAGVARQRSMLMFRPRGLRSLLSATQGVSMDQRQAGWFLAFWITLHLFLVPLPEYAGAAILILLLAGAILRAMGRTFSPGWLGIPALAGIPLLAGGGIFPSVAAAAGSTAGLLLLGPLTPRRGRGVFLCAVFLLGAVAMEPGASAILLVADAAILLLLLQSLHTPVAVDWRVLLGRTLRLAVPVAFVVSLAFAVFPALAGRTQVALAGFSGELNPGDFAGIRPSNRVALIARFPDALPPSTGWYWRGQTLRVNQGLRWRREAGHADIISAADPEWRYAIRPGYGDNVVPLDLPAGAPPMSDGAETWLEATSAPADDPPAAADLEVPREIRSDSRVTGLVIRQIPSPTSTPAAIDALLEFFRDGRFSYSVAPGRVGGVGSFLTRIRRGYCEHYAAASANLLRLAGVPSRVVTGYRGGRWNPWLRTISIRDADAHAWVEAWDPVAQHWIRFDPTLAVSPDFSLRMQIENDPASWPWYRTAVTFSEAVVERVKVALGAAAQIFGPWILAAALLAWLANSLLKTWRAPRDARAALARAEREAMVRDLPRLPGETPLAWLARLAKSSRCNPASVQALARFYEAEIYAPPGQPEASHRPRIQWIGANPK